MTATFDFKMAGLVTFVTRYLFPNFELSAQSFHIRVKSSHGTDEQTDRLGAMLNGPPLRWGIFLTSCTSLFGKMPTYKIRIYFWSTGAIWHWLL